MRILVFQHLDVEHPGVFRDLWDASGHQWLPVELDAGEPIPPLEGFDLLAVMGGPMDVWQEEQHPWLIPEKAAIRRWVRELNRPYLGICLGHQLLADALGGTVELMQRPEVGLATIELTDAGHADPLLAGFPAMVETLQWHGAEVSRLPEGGVVLAANAACPIQAMRIGRQAWGFQYHMEITPSTVADWGLIPEYRASLETALGAERAAGLAAEVAPKLPAFRDSAELLAANLEALVAQASLKRSA
ncbi:amidotransferase [Azorhizobium oxalatiphilum]|uniref:Amidotransferase n=1 Tax=Azorhizobium oxalatiphilum TaxID=980631 RepID=A0A917BSZ5_9HYPH|nr:type 1 glutamine amidotransferase [Azorhizobium oxalatiphilum]GGF57607.1 amidotransferase [Azorhizobium oxalatiphilum]